MQHYFRYGIGYRCVCLAGLRGFVTRRLPQMPRWSSLPMTHPLFSSCFRADTPHVACCYASTTFLHGRSVFCRGWGRVAAPRACSCHAGQRAGAILPLLRGAPLDATVGRHGAGCFMPVDCRTADGGDVVTAVRTPRTAAAKRRQCLDTSSPRWRRDKARQDEATRPGD